MPQFTVIETRRVRSLNPANDAGLDTLVTYSDQAERLHTVTIGGIDPTPDQIDAAILAQHGDRTQHRGRTVGN